RLVHVRERAGAALALVGAARPRERDLAAAGAEVQVGPGDEGPLREREGDRAVATGGPLRALGRERADPLVGPDLLAALRHGLREGERGLRLLAGRMLRYTLLV